jgi:hypothetical protein
MPHIRSGTVEVGMTKMDYDRHGGRNGENRRLATTFPKNASARFLVLPRDGGPVVASFDRHADALAERCRLQQDTGREHMVRKVG